MNIAAAKQAIAFAGNRRVSPSRHAGEIRQALLAALREDVPCSLSEVARRLGYTTTERLYQADRKLCHKIAARYRQSGRSHWWKKPGATRICETDRLKETLEQSLGSIEATSVHRIARSLGYSNEGYIQRKLPEPCRAIGEKIAQAKQARPEKMRRILKSALDEHPAPTLRDLSLRLGYSTSTILRAHEPDLCDQLAARYRGPCYEAQG
jgi:AraC-like DNA-binding protein